MSPTKELKLFIDAIDSGVARMMLLDGAVFEFPAALLREGDGVTLRLALEPANDCKDEIDKLLDSLGDSL